MIEVKTEGIYIFQSVHDTYGTAYFKPRHDLSHLVKRLIDGPFEDVLKEGRFIISGHTVAKMRLTEILADHTGQEAKKFLDASTAQKAFTDAALEKQAPGQG